jgi:DNA-binding response OmpR family regulator
MKLLVLEDEYSVLKGAFEYLNTKYYKGDLIVENYSKTQEFKNMENVNEYERIFVDISLQRSSDQDGYSFIKSLKEKVEDIEKKVIIITGSDKVTDKLKEFNLPSLRILSKPITFLDLKSVM